MQFTDAVTVAGTRRTADGYLIAEAKAVRTGIQTYLGAEVGKPDLPTVKVYRAPDQVFAQDSLQSFSHAPITIDHPADPVTAENWKDLSVGEVSTAAKQDGQWVTLPLILKDAKAIQSVEAGKRELSAGYDCELDWTPGTTVDGESYDAQQRGIKINHLALVDRARAGSQARIGDGAISWGVAPIPPTTDKETVIMTDALRTVVVDGLSVQTTDQGAQAIDKLTKDRDDARKAIADAEATHKAEIAAKDKELATKDATIDDLKAKQLDPAKLDKLVADRSAIVAKAKKVAPTLDVTGKSNGDIRRAAVAAKLGDAAVKDKSDDYVEARFDTLVDAAPADPFRQVIQSGIHDSGDAEAKADAARLARNNALRDGWKTPAGKSEVN